jgi:thiol:disulfide interchange protein DsbD
MFSGRIEKLPRSGEWMIWVRKLMGWVLVGMAAYFIRPLLSESAAVLTLSAVALAAGLHLGWIDKARAGFATFKYIKTAVVRGPGVGWQQYSQALLDEATATKKPVIIDFSATWCTPCRELDEKTFHDPTVVRMSEDGFVMIKVDLTRSGNAEYERLVSEYEVKGVPTVIFIDARGRERRDLRLVDYLPPDAFVQLMENLKTTNEE